MADTVKIDLGIMIDGFRALMWLQQHGNEVARCRECSRFAAALLRGQGPEQSTHLCCGVAQAMQVQVDDAIEVIAERTANT